MRTMRQAIKHGRRYAPRAIATTASSRALLTIALLAGLSVHMNQVHKESLSSVENALPNRQGLDIEIFGMEGVPEDIVQQHNQRIIQNFYTAQAERQAATGNPPRGQSGGQGPAKKIKYETPDELKKRLAEHRAKVAAQKAAAANGVAPAAAPVVDGQSPAQGVRISLFSSSCHETPLAHQILPTRPRPSRLHNQATPTPRQVPYRPSPAPCRPTRRQQRRQARSPCRRDRPVHRPRPPPSLPRLLERPTTTIAARRSRDTPGAGRRRWTSSWRAPRDRAAAPPPGMISTS